MNRVEDKFSKIDSLVKLDKIVILLGQSSAVAFKANALIELALVRSIQG
jgi:hypothetical protein